MTMIDIDPAEAQTIRWQAAEGARDDLTAALRTLDARGHPIDMVERQRIEAAITLADAETEAAKIRFHRSLGDHEQADRLEAERDPGNEDNDDD